MLEEIFQDSWAYQDILRKGEARGEARGKEQGKEQGRLEGQLLASRQAIISVTKARFAKLEPIVKRNVEFITDVESLQNLLVKISTAQNVDEAMQDLFDVIRSVELH